jgi:RNA polymerase sigma-70 factor (ECF subfamily)
MKDRLQPGKFDAWAKEGLDVAMNDVYKDLKFFEMPSDKYKEKAFKIAQAALRHEDDALDAVQDAMLQLARAYSDRPAEEWKPLFYRILQNRIRDVQRRRAVRTRFVSFFGGTASEEEHDPIAEAPGPRGENPLEQVTADDAMRALERALDDLPARQREAFMLRNFEGLDVAQTAVAMGCTQGSVKTHYSRAVHRLREVLAEHGEGSFNE